MKTSEYSGSNLQYMILEPDSKKVDEDYPLIFMLHGFGADMRDLIGLCEKISSSEYI